MFDATAQDRDADANSLDSLNSFAGESRLGVERKFWGAEALLWSFQRNRYCKRASVSPTWIITRGVQQIVLSRGAHLTVTQFLWDVIFILKVHSINLSQELKNKFTIPLNINCLDLLGRIASSCSCASHRKLLLEGKTSAISSSTLSDDVMKVKYHFLLQIILTCKRLSKYQKIILNNI